tara:strand:- start:415 stop:567 length:153 start_codon:yes stop_codon:yes gene_type:complete
MGNNGNLSLVKSFMKLSLKEQEQFLKISDKLLEKPKLIKRKRNNKKYIKK